MAMMLHFSQTCDNFQAFEVYASLLYAFSYDAFQCFSITFQAKYAFHGSTVL